MTRPTARVLALLEILQSGGTHTVARLADRLDVDERTLRRYAAHLTDLGIPVQSVRGRYGGYRLAPGYRLPPLMLTDDEAVAVMLGLISGQRKGLVGTSAVAAESAVAKLRRVLPEALGHRLEALLDTAEFTVGAVPVATPGTNTLLTMAEAARENRVVQMTYTRADGSCRERTIEPYGIVSHSGRWYVIGVDSATGATRNFRLDRMSALTVLDATFVAPAGFNAAEEVLAGLARATYRYEISLLVEGSVDDVRRLFSPVVATVQGGEKGWARVRINAERLDWVPALLAGLGVPFVIEQPDALRGLVRTLAERLTTAARSDALEAASRGGQDSSTFPDGGVAG